MSIWMPIALIFPYLLAPWLMIADGRYVLPNGPKVSIIWHLKAVPNGILIMNLELCDLSITMAAYIWHYKIKTFASGRQNCHTGSKHKNKILKFICISYQTGGKEIPVKFVGAQLMVHWISNFLVQAIWPLLIQGTINNATICISNCISKSLHSISLSILTNSYVSPHQYLLQQGTELIWQVL